MKTLAIVAAMGGLGAATGYLIYTLYNVITTVARIAKTDGAE